MSQKKRSNPFITDGENQEKAITNSDDLPVEDTPDNPDSLPVTNDEVGSENTAWSHTADPKDIKPIKLPTIPSKESIKRKTFKDMKDLGVYKPQYNRIIDIYAWTVHQYYLALSDFMESGCQYETETASGNMKKSSIVSTMETLRKDILQYSDRLGLNPKSSEKPADDGKKESPLVRALMKRG